MTKVVVPFRRWHLAWLLADGAAAGGQMQFDIDTLAVLEKQNSWTAVLDGDPIACGGLVEQWPGRYTAWTYLNAKSGPHMRFVTRAVAEKLDAVVGRIETTVRCDFKAGHRWMKLLGFEVETERMKAYGPEGEDHAGYVRFNKG